jgi:predicted DNA-binding transcriptional regulator AlpA
MYRSASPLGAPVRSTLPDSPASRLIDEHEAAELLHLSVACLRRRRPLRQEPVWIKIGRAVRYSPADIRVFLTANTQGGATHA